MVRAPSCIHGFEWGHKINNFNTEKYFYLTSRFCNLSHYKAVITKVLLKHWLDDNSVALPCCLQINEAFNIKKKSLYRAYVNIPAIRNNHLQHNPTIMFYIYIFVFESILHVFTKKNTWVVHLRTQNINIFTSTLSVHSTYLFNYKILTRTLGENRKCTKPYFLPVVFLLQNNKI